MNEEWSDPDPEVIAFGESIRSEGGLLIHDLGCGSGRHAEALARIGLRVIASDVLREPLVSISNSGIGPVVGSMFSTPFHRHVFDAVVAFHLVYHATVPNMDRAIGKIFRTLKPSGRVYMTLAALEHGSYGSGRIIADNTYLPESGVIRHFSSQDEVERLMKAFQDVEYGISTVDYITRSGAVIPCVHWHISARKGNAS